ncbi:MAG: hypothetical protein AAFO70_07325 [Pseudomonadota bacterium]
MNTLSKITLAVALSLAATAAQSESRQCKFTQQCTVGDPCEETDYDLTIALDGETVELEDISQTLIADVLPGEPAIFVSRTDSGDSYTLAVNKEGAASYWVRYPSSEIEIVYTGICKG